MSISAWGLAVPFGHDPNQMTVMPWPRMCLANRATSSAISFGWSMRACWSMGSVYWFSRRSQPRFIQKKGKRWGHSKFSGACLSGTVRIFAPPFRVVDHATWKK